MNNIEELNQKTAEEIWDLSINCVVLNQDMDSFLRQTKIILNKYHSKVLSLTQTPGIRFDS